MSDQPREWEILKCENNGDRFIKGPDTKDNEFVKVIEKSHYDTLKHEFKMLQAGAERINNENIKLRSGRRANE